MKLKNIKANYDLRKKHHSHMHMIIRPEKHSHALLEIEYLHKISHLYTHYRTINKAGVFIFFIRLACSGRFSSFDQIKVTSLAGIWPFGRHFSEISREMCFLHTGFCIPKYRKIFHIWRYSRGTKLRKGMQIFLGNKKHSRCIWVIHNNIADDMMLIFHFQSKAVPRQRGKKDSWNMCID